MSRKLVILLLATSACNSQQGPAPVVKLDLREFGYRFSADAPLYDDTELSFLSEERLAVSISQQLFDAESHAPPGGENPHATIIILDVPSGRIVAERRMPIEWAEGALQRVLEGRLSVWNSTGLRICSPNLRCDPPLRGQALFRCLRTARELCLEA